MPVGHTRTLHHSIDHYFMLYYYDDAMQWFPASFLSGVPTTTLSDKL